MAREAPCDERLVAGSVVAGGLGFAKPAKAPKLQAKIENSVHFARTSQLHRFLKEPQ